MILITFTQCIIILLMVTSEYIATFIAIGTATSAIITSFVMWRIDRRRLLTLEIENGKMRKEFEKHKQETIETFKEVREMIHNSNTQVLDKVDDLKMYLLQSKITIKGENEKNN